MVGSLVWLECLIKRITRIYVRIERGKDHRDGLWR